MLRANNATVVLGISHSSIAVFAEAGKKAFVCVLWARLGLRVTHPFCELLQLTDEFAKEKAEWMTEQRQFMEADSDQRAKMVADKSAAVVSVPECACAPRF